MEKSFDYMTDAEKFDTLYRYMNLMRSLLGGCICALVVIFFLLMAIAWG